jgi:hypothetical protein
MTSAPAVADDPGRDTPLEVDARQVLGRTCSAFKRLIDALPGRIRRAAHLQQALGVDSALGWQIYRAANSDDPLAAGLHLPGPVAIARIFDAARRLHVPEAIIVEAEQSYAGFTDLIQRHADDQRTFQALLKTVVSESATDEPKANGGLKERRTTFRGNSHLWGVQTRVRIVCSVVYPGAVDGSTDCLSVDGMVDLRSLRRNVEVRIGHQRMHELPEDPEEVDPGLIPEFCTRPLPALRVKQTTDDRVDVMLAPQTLGKRGGVTYFSRHLTRSASQGTRDTHFSFNCFVSVPTELQFVDLLIPHGWVDPSTAASAFFACNHDPRACYLRRAEDRLQPYAPAVFLGRGLERLETREFPQYPHLIAHVLTDLGWDADILELYRLRVDYPLLHSSTLLTVRAHEAEIDQGTGH